MEKELMDNIRDLPGRLRSALPTGLLAIGATLALSSACAAQCAFWPDGEIFPISGPFHASSATMWDPDGGGALSSVLVVGGYYGVFTWDGLAWRELGDPVAGTDLENVDVLTVHNGTLIAGGTFVDRNKRRVAWWTGNGWAPLGTGLGSGAPGDSVKAMISFGGELIAVGDFALAGGAPVNNAARWNGATWQAMGNGVAFNEFNSYATSIVSFDDDGAGPNPARLHAGASNGGVWRWDGALWSNIGGTVSHVLSLAVHNGVLYVGSEPLPQLPGIPPTLSTWVKRWVAPDWVPAVTAPMTSTGPTYTPKVAAMLSFAGSLVVAGRFSNAGGAPASNIVRITASAYLPMGSGVVGAYADDQVSGLATNGSQLFAVGNFDQLGDGTYIAGVAAWDGVAWSRIAPATVTYALAPFGAKMAVGGAFEDLGGLSQNGFGNPAVNLALWDGVNMTRLGTGINGTVRALREFGSTATVKSLVVAGDFTAVTGFAAGRVAKWNQSDTNPFQTGWSTMGSGFNNSVHSLEFGYNGVLIAAGDFTASGATPLSRMARWSTSTNQWLKFATAGGDDMNGAVRAVKVYTVSPTNPLSNVVTIAGGDFTTANGGTARRIAQWIDNPQFGSTPWAAMGAGFNNTVHAIERYSSSIYAGGAFTADGNNAAVFNRIARWTGSLWVTVGNGIGFNGTVRSLKSISGFLYAAGDFTSVDGLPANHLARWNGTSWSPVGPGIAGERYVLAAHNSEVLIGGRSIPIATPPLDSPALGRYSEGGLPWIVAQPVPQTVNCGEDAMLTMTPAEGYSNAFPAMQWRKNGVPLIDGPTAGGSVIIGSTYATLTITNVGSADAGSYDCVISNICTNVISASAVLTVINCCPADIAPIGALDGQVNVSDLLAVIGAWGACAAPPCAADINGDNLINVTDLLAVIGAWGACP